MFGILLTGLGGLLEEFSFSVGKKEVREGRISYYTFGFLIQFFSALLIAIIGFVSHDFVFSVASLSTFIPRVIVGIIEIQLAVIAMVHVERGSFGFVKLATLPILLGVDLVMGYSIQVHQVFGILFIVLPIGMLFFMERSRAKGLWLVFIVAVLAAIDLSIYKYDISHFNSVEGEQAIIAFILSLYFFLMAVIIKRENPISFLKRPMYLAQATSSGLAYVSISFAYLFAPAASVITSAFRGFSILFSILSGNFYFHEKNFLIRIALFVLVLVGLILLI